MERLWKKTMYLRDLEICIFRVKLLSLLSVYCFLYNCLFYFPDVNDSREHVILIKMGFILLVATCFLTRVSCQLIINVSSGEADANVYRESVTGNMSTETVTINFLTPAGMWFSSFIHMHTTLQKDCNTWRIYNWGGNCSFIVQGEPLESWYRISG